MNEKELEAEMKRRNTPRVKNIALCNVEIKAPDGQVLEVIKPGVTVVGERYLEFVGDNMGPLKWINRPRENEYKIVFDTSRGGE